MYTMCSLKIYQFDTNDPLIKTKLTPSLNPKVENSSLNHSRFYFISRFNDFFVRFCENIFIYNSKSFLVQKLEKYYQGFY